MKILTFIRGYYPSEKHGGPPISVKNLCDLTSQLVDYYVVTTDHDMGDNKRLESINSGWNRVDGVQVLYLPDKDESIATFRRIIDQIKPDLIYLHSLFDKYTLRMLFLSKTKGVPCILATRGELSEKLYKNRKKAMKDLYIFVIRLFGLLHKVTFHATFSDEALAIKRRLTDKTNRVYTISNVPSGKVFTLNYKNKKAGTLKCIYVSRIVENKNLYDVIVALREVKCNVKLDIFGFKQDLMYWNKCEALFDTLPRNVKIEYKGELKHNLVISTIAEYDTLVFPTYSENYGQVIAESIIACCPPIISDRTPWSDIDATGAGFVIPLHDIGKLTGAIELIANMDSVEYNNLIDNLSKYYHQKFDIEGIIQNYISMYNTSCLKKGNK